MTQPMYKMEEGESDEDPVSITDDDLRTLEVPKIRTFVWNSQHGFALQWPLELQEIREDIERDGVSGALFSELCKGRYAYWSWRKDWFITAGFLQAFKDRRDYALLERAPLSPLPSICEQWVDPPALIDLNLGDSLLRAAKIKFTDFSQTTIRYETHRTPSTPSLKAPMLETLYGVGDIILRMETEYPAFIVGMSLNDRLPYLRANCNLRIHLKELLHAKTSPDILKIIFGPAMQG